MTEKPPIVDDDEEVDEEDEKVLEVRSKVQKEDIWREIILTSGGRDKAFVSTTWHLVLSFMLI
jgi:hypothetical protein